jgi:hypothetical protein
VLPLLVCFVLCWWFCASYLILIVLFVPKTADSCVVVDGLLSCCSFDFQLG